MKPQNRKHPVKKRSSTTARSGNDKSAPSEARPSFALLVRTYLLSPASVTPFRMHLSAGLLIFALAFILYSNTIFHDYALDDDLVYRLNASVKKGLQGLPEIWTTTNMYGFNQQNFGAYRPFTQTLFALEYELFGLAPHTQHFISVLMFALTSFLLYLLIRRILKDYPSWLSLMVSLLFVVHPVHTEVVANIKSSDELISFLFGFVLTFLALFRYLDTKRKFWLAISVSMFMIGLLSKEHIITLFPMIPLSLYFMSHEKLKGILLLSLPYLLPVAIFMVMRLMFTESANEQIVFLDNFIWHIPGFSERAGTILFVLLDYLRLMVFPFPLSCDYSWAETPLKSLWSFWPLFSLLIYGGMLAGAISLFRRKDIIAWCILFFLASISIYSHVYAGLAATMAERFLFTPSLPVLLALGILLFRLYRRISEKKWLIRTASMTLLAVLIIFSVKTMSRNAVWKNSDTLFLSDVEHAPNSARLNKSAGDVYINRGREEQDEQKRKAFMKDALVYLNRAYVIYSDYPDNLLDLGTAWFYLGEYDSAQYYWDRHAVLQPWSNRVAQNRDYLKSGWLSRGQELGKQTRGPEAIQAFRRSLSYDSLYHPAWFYMGLVYADMKDYPLAEASIRKALAVDSVNVDYWYNLGGLLFTVNNRDGARLAWEKALILQPAHELSRQGLDALNK